MWLSARRKYCTGTELLSDTKDVLTDEDRENLIHLMSQRPSLFASKHAGYKDQQVKIIFGEN